MTAPISKTLRTPILMSDYRKSVETSPLVIDSQEQSLPFTPDSPYDLFRMRLCAAGWTDPTGLRRPDARFPALRPVPAALLDPIVRFLKTSFPFEIKHDSHRVCTVSQSFEILFRIKPQETHLVGSVFYELLHQWIQEAFRPLGFWMEGAPFPPSDYDFQCKVNTGQAYDYAENWVTHFAAKDPQGERHGTLKELSNDVRKKEGTFKRFEPHWSLSHSQIERDGYLVTYQFKETSVDVLFARKLTQTKQFTIQCFDMDVTSLIWGGSSTLFPLQGPEEEIWQGLMDLHSKEVRFLSADPWAWAKAMWLYAHEGRTTAKLPAELYVNLMLYCSQYRSPSEGIIHLLEDVWGHHLAAPPDAGVYMTYHVCVYLFQRGFPPDEIEKVRTKMEAFIAKRGRISGRGQVLLEGLRDIAISAATMGAYAFIAKAAARNKVYTTYHDGLPHFAAYVDSNTLLSLVQPHEDLQKLIQLPADGLEQAGAIIRAYRSEMLPEEIQNDHIVSLFARLKVDSVELHRQALELLNIPQEDLRYLGFTLLLLCYRFNKTEGILSDLVAFLPEAVTGGRKGWQDTLEFLSEEAPALIGLEHFLELKSPSVIASKLLDLLQRKPQDPRASRCAGIWLTYAPIIFRQNPYSLSDLLQAFAGIDFAARSKESLLLVLRMIVEYREREPSKREIVEQLIFSAVDRLISAQRFRMAYSFLLGLMDRKLLLTGQQSTSILWLQCCRAIYMHPSGGKTAALKAWNTAAAFGVWGQKQAHPEYRAFLVPFSEELFGSNGSAEEQAALTAVSMLREDLQDPLSLRVAALKEKAARKAIELRESTRQIQQGLSNPLATNHDEFRGVAVRGIALLCQEGNADPGLRQAGEFLAHPHFESFFSSDPKQYLELLFIYFGRILQHHGNSYDSQMLLRLLAKACKHSIGDADSIETITKILEEPCAIHSPLDTVQALKDASPRFLDVLKQTGRAESACRFLLAFRSAAGERAWTADEFENVVVWAIAGALTPAKQCTAIQLFKGMPYPPPSWHPDKQLACYTRLAEAFLLYGHLTEAALCITHILALDRLLPPKATDHMPAKYLEWATKLAKGGKATATSAILDYLEKKKEHVYEGLFHSLNALSADLIQQIPWVYARVFVHYQRRSSASHQPHILRIEACVRKLLPSHKETDLALEIIERYVPPASALLDEVAEWAVEDANAGQKMRVWRILKHKVNSLQVALNQSTAGDLPQRWEACYLNALKVLRSGCVQSLTGDFDAAAAKEFEQFRKQGSGFDTLAKALNRSGLRLQASRLLMESCLAGMKDPKAKSDFLKELYSYRRDQLKEEINDIRDEDYQRANLLLADRLLHARNTTLFHAGCALLGWMLPSSTVQTQPSLIKALATARECALEFKAEKHQELLKHLDDALRQVPLPRLGQQMLSDLTGHLGEWGGDARLPTARFILSYNQQLQDIGTHSPMRTAIYVFSVLMIGYFVAHEMNKVYRQKNVSAGDLKTISIYTASLLFFFFIRNYFLPRR